MAEHFDEQAAMQHYLVCGSEDCQKNGQFYCNDCRRPLCKQCRNEHLKSPDTKIHEVVIDIPEVILFPETKQEKRKIEPMEEVYTHMKVTEKQMDQSEQKSDLQQTLSLSPSVIKVKEYSVPGVKNAWHISYDKSGRLWVSDNWKNLVMTDLQGNLHQRIHTSCLFEGSHTTTQDEDLVYTDSDNNVICKMTPDKVITEIINLKAEKYKPISVHSSRINGDLLVGMIALEESRLTRYSKTGKEIRSIKWDDEGKELYEYPHYITENINGDICTSDYDKEAVVVVNKSGEYRFSYKGPESAILPRGICTDALGHILVCDEDGDVHLLDQDGGFLSFVLSFQQGLRDLRGLCLDDENNLYVGQNSTKTLTVYKYLK